MFDGLAIVLPLVLHFLYLAEDYHHRHPSLDLPSFPTPHSSRPLRFLLLPDPNSQLVLVTCCLRDYPSLRALHEDAFVYNCQPRLSGAESPSFEVRQPTSEQLPCKHKPKRLHPLHVDPMARLRQLPPPISHLLALHPKKKRNNNNLHLNGLHDPHRIPNPYHRIRQ